MIQSAVAFQADLEKLILDLQDRACGVALPLCLSEIKLAHTDDEVRQEMA
jgi:hypothetical protein